LGPSGPPIPQSQQPTPHISEAKLKEERREPVEPAARKMDVDEDYDDEGEEEKKAPGPVRSERNSPRTGGGAPPEQKS